MIIIAGLGNPEEKYGETRHNIGFVAIDKIKEKYNFSDFVFPKNFNSLISEGKIGEKRAILAKPQTFMNNSGIAIKKILDYYKISSSSLFVVHDDIDISLGKIKIAKERGPAGHNGVKSIIKEIKTKEFSRLRIGIKPKEKPNDTSSFVLKKFNKEEKREIEKTLINLIENLEEEIK